MSHFSIVNEILPMLDFFLYNVIFPVLHYFFSVTIVSVKLINLKFWFWKFSAFSVLQEEAQLKSTTVAEARRMN